ncbi:MAG: MATE family efflux transporter [Ruminococcus sp.]|nr:MATE family efflux transporter [Ruminococcus sp.]
MTQTRNLTQGKVSEIILSFFFPMLMANLLQQIYTFADTAIVGKGLGDNALAAVGNMSSLTFLIIGFSLGMANGFSIIIAHNYGAKDYAALRKAIASSIKLSAVITVILTAFGVVFLREIMVLMQTPDLILNESLSYGYIIFGGLVATIAYNVCSGILRALGDSRTPFISIMISTVVNIVLNCVFIFGLGTGVEGAAIATVISQAISAIVCYAKIRKIEIIRLSREDFRRDRKMNSELLRNGLPMACMNSITAVGCIVVQYFVNGLGVAYTSAYSACSRYLNLFMLPASTAGLTISSFTSQNYGAGEYARIKEGLHVCLKIAFVSYVVLGSVMAFFPEFLAGIMLNEKETIGIAVQFLPICGIMLFAVDFLFVFRSCVQGMGYPFIPMCSGILEMVLRIAAVVLLIPNLEFRATAFAEVFAWSGALLMNFAAYKAMIGKKLGNDASIRKKRIRSV